MRPVSDIAWRRRRGEARLAALSAAFARNSAVRAAEETRRIADVAAKVAARADVSQDANHIFRAPLFKDPPVPFPQESVRVRSAVGPEMARRVASGEPQALVHAVASLAAAWLEKAGTHISLPAPAGATDCLVAGGATGGLLAAALELCAMLELSPQGRKALAQLGRKPVLQESEGE